jgi:hypothetical protein
MPSRGFNDTQAGFILTEQRENVFVVSIQLYDSVSKKPVRTLPNSVRFFARVYEDDGQAYVDLGDFNSLIPFDSVEEARQYIHVLFELEDN